MKKIIAMIVMLVCVIGSVIINLKYNEPKFEAPFMDVDWARTTEVDIEYLRFSKEGDFVYYCGCGNPVENSDVCEKYTYNENNKTIKLECLEPDVNTLTEIKVISYDDDLLTLDFNGDIRTFEKE